MLLSLAILKRQIILKNSKNLKRQMPIYPEFLSIAWAKLERLYPTFPMMQINNIFALDSHLHLLNYIIQTIQSQFVSEFF